MLISEQDIRVAIIGLGYVGLPLAVAFGDRYPTVGFDISKDRVQMLGDHVDTNNEVTPEQLQEVNSLTFTASVDDIADCNVFIVTVPTPIDIHNNPDLTPMIMASNMLAKILKKNNFVIYESTVYPGAVEEECVPLLTKGSGLVFNEDYFVGYSPERINPGDKERTVVDIIKVTSGSTPAAADFVDNLYKKVITAGTHKVSSIQVAEAAKVIENTQRDLNIALINELAIIFNKLNIDTKEVLEAAGTKWNFMPFSPGLVGGHCIGVDPYYLTFKAQSIGYNPEVILAGRRINDNMGKYVASEIIKLMLKKKIHVMDSEVLILGYTFKENCPDVRNTKVVDIVNELSEYGANITINDPYLSKNQELKNGQYDAVILAVGHDEFIQMGVDAIRNLGKEVSVLYDVKHIFPASKTDGCL